MNEDKKLLETVFLIAICPLVRRQMAIKKSVSNYLSSTFVDIINVFDCRLSCVILGLPTPTN